MDWNRGYSSSYYISVLDRFTLREIQRIEITGGNIKRTSESLRESATIDCINYSANSEQIIRVWLDTKQSGESNHTPLFTGIATSPAKNINGRLIKNSLECYSLLKIAQDILLQRGWYAPIGIDAGTLIKDLLSVVPGEIEIVGNTPPLKSSIIAEDGENRLSMAEKVLGAIGNWRMRIDGNGHITIEPYATNPVAVFDAINNDSIEPSLSITYDWYNCPNVYRATVDDNYAVARDDSPDSPLSTVNRGREVWYEDSDVYLAENQTLSEYAAEALKQAQQVATSISYDRRFHPDVSVGDVIRLTYPAQDILGLYLVTSQDITLGYNAKTAEEVVKI